MQYQEAVRTARTLVARSEADQWDLARLTWEQVEAGATRRQWAADVGVAESWAGSLYRVWGRWRTSGTEARPSFTEAMAEIHTPARAEDTRETGSEAAARARQAIRNMPAAERAGVIRDALADQDTADEVFRLGPDTGDDTDAARRAAEQAYANSARDMSERMRNADRSDRERSNRAHTLRWHEAQTQIRKATSLIAAAAKVIAPVAFTDEEREFLADDLAKVRAAVGLLESALTGASGADWDAEFAKVAGS